VTEDVEARLRAALHAHADLVQEPADGAGAPPAPGRSRAARRWGSAVLAAAAAAAVVGGAVWLGAGGTAGSDRAASPSPDSTSTMPADGPSAVASAAGPSALDAGRPFDLYTHCGVLGADVGGVWFAAEPPLTDGAGNPPAGWANPEQPGTLTMVSPTEAVFRDDAGHEVRLRADDAARPALCE
jgi:hypothetical protein